MFVLPQAAQLSIHFFWKIIRIKRPDQGPTNEGQKEKKIAVGNQTTTSMVLLQMHVVCRCATNAALLLMEG